jgi:hypothetical protein
MQHIHTAALLALADLLVRAADRRATSDPKKDQEHDPDEEEDVEHRSVLVAVDEVVDAHQQESTDADGSNDYEGDFEVEHLRLGLLLVALLLCQLRPDLMPVIWAQLLQANVRVDPVQLPRKQRRGGLQSAQDLVQVLLVDRKRGCYRVSTLGGVVWECHVEHSSVGLADVK